jgi:hypothetical protein
MRVVWKVCTWAACWVAQMVRRRAGSSVAQSADEKAQQWAARLVDVTVHGSAAWKVVQWAEQTGGNSAERSGHAWAELWAHVKAVRKAGLSAYCSAVRWAPARVGY